MKLQNQWIATQNKKKVEIIRNTIIINGMKSMDWHTKQEKKVEITKSMDCHTKQEKKVETIRNTIIINGMKSNQPDRDSILT